MYELDQQLFLALNFDGGFVMDQIMLIISGVKMWIPLYLLIVYMVYRRVGWKNVLIFVALVGVGIGFVDIVAGIFKHTGLLGDVFNGITPAPRLRPMFAPELEGLTYFPQEAIAGRYGTISAHAATITVLALMSSWVVRRRWFTILMVCSALLICYSRIYLAKHYPLDLLLGIGVGVIIGVKLLYLFSKLKRN